MPTPCAASRISVTSGWCGSFPARCGTAGPPPYGRRASAATPGWACSPPAPPSGPIRWDFPASSWKPSSTGRTSAPSSSCAGADLMDGTPIYDIKPYIPYADCHPDAAAGFTARPGATTWRSPARDSGPPCRRPTATALRGVLANDPRPSYQHDPERVYGMEFGGLEVHFIVDGARSDRAGHHPPLRSLLWNCAHQHLFAYCRAAQLFRAPRGSWATPSRRCPPRSPSWKRNWVPPVRPGGQNGAPDRCRADLSGLRPHPAGHRGAGAGRPAACPSRSAGGCASRWPIRCAAPFCPTCCSGTTRVARRWSWCSAPPLTTGCCRC